MSISIENYKKIKLELESKNITLVAVSKLKPTSDIETLYNLNQIDFGENYVQELVQKQIDLKHLNINWHFIGHLQTNKVKYIAPFVYLIHSVDSLKLLQEINKQAQKNKRTINCLLQVYIAKEETKFGLDENEINDIYKEIADGKLNYINILGFMTMASFVNDEKIVEKEFEYFMNIIKSYTNKNTILSFGMSQDYKIAIKMGSNMVRIGSLLFGARS